MRLQRPKPTSGTETASPARTCRKICVQGVLCVVSSQSQILSACGREPAITSDCKRQSASSSMGTKQSASYAASARGGGGHIEMRTMWKWPQNQTKKERGLLKLPHVGGRRRDHHELEHGGRAGWLAALCRYLPAVGPPEPVGRCWPGRCAADVDQPSRVIASINQHQPGIRRAVVATPAAGRRQGRSGEGEKVRWDTRI